MSNILEIIFRFVRRNQAQFLALLLVVAVLDYLAKFPYFSAFLMFPYPWNSITILWIVIAILFRLGERFSFGTALVLLSIILILSLLGKNNMVEPLGNYVFGLLLLGFFEILVRCVVYYKV